MDQLLEAYESATNRILFFDYDGVLSPIVERPEQAAPASDVLALLRKLSDQSDTKVVVVSGRDHETLEKWLGELPVDMSAEHGHFSKKDGVWHFDNDTDMSWEDDVEATMAQLVIQYPGSHVETKRASVVWHYRSVEAPIDQRSAMTAIEQAAKDRADVMPGKCVIDVRAPGVDKGSAVQSWFAGGEWDFVVCIGDDVTDEAMFVVLPESAWTIKVGPGKTSARYRFDHQIDVINLLSSMSALIK